MHDGLRAEVLPVARNLAEIRGLLNQAIRRLERLEGDILAERHARIDDLGLLVDLVSSGWKGVSDRLDDMEATPPPPRSPRSGTRLATLRAGQDEPEAAAPPHLAVELDPAAERDRELARDREPEPRAAAVDRPERPEDALSLLGRDPRPRVGDVDRDGAVGARQREVDAARRPASSGRRSRAGSR